MAEISISDCATNTTGVAESGSQIELKHNGDTCTLICPDYASSVTFQVKHTLSTHTVNKITNMNMSGIGTKSDTSEITLKTGETHVIGAIKEQTFGDDDPLTNNRVYIDDEDKIITITSWKDNAGTSGGTINTTDYIYSWSCTDAKDKVLDSGTEKDKDVAINDIKAYDTANPGTPFHGIVTDGNGHVVFDRLFNQPTATDYTWLYWLIGGVVAAAVILIILYWFLKRRAGATAQVATAPPDVNPPVTVVK